MNETEETVSGGLLFGAMIQIIKVFANTLFIYVIQIIQVKPALLSQPSQSWDTFQLSHHDLTGIAEFLIRRWEKESWQAMG